MISQSCPRCGSNRIRRGYRVTRWWQKIFGRYNLLCNKCNFEFIGFAVPGTVSSNSKRRRKKHNTADDAEEFKTEKSELQNMTLSGSESENHISVEDNQKQRGIKVRKRVRVKLK